ncbi:MAG TPA: metallophosphoesterase, partial [Tepidisphaeraceae bacterium]|nr:metallophosphoesterase [Tepidisphaeraceae bacterium]
MINRIGLACLAAILTCTCCTGFVAAADELRITFLHVNDVHGQLEPTTQGRHSIGGYARLSTAISRIRQTHPTDKLFLIHAGDEFSRGDELTAQSVGSANIELMNYLRFDIWTPGNGDFYIGLPSLKARIAQATCKVVGANVTERIGGKKFTEPFVIEQAGPIKVAFLGLCFTRVE